jgi:hypothetical protein
MSHGTYDEYRQSRKVPRTLKNIDHKCSTSQSGLWHRPSLSRIYGWILVPETSQV